MVHGRSVCDRSSRRSGALCIRRAHASSPVRMHHVMMRRERGEWSRYDGCRGSTQTATCLPLGPCIYPFPFPLACRIERITTVMHERRRGFRAKDSFGRTANGRDWSLESSPPSGSSSISLTGREKASLNVLVDKRMCHICFKMVINRIWG